ncbi:MAG: M20/M25/M40 family metallo-hydrolase [Chloroflexota bacterium]
MYDLIKKLAETWGPSGYEHHIRAAIREEVENLADEITVDGMGNLICRMGDRGTRIMVAAHMDEIGVMAMYAEPTSRYLRFENIGGLLQTTLLGSRVRFEDGTIGTIGVHDQWGASRTKAPALSQFYIDVSNGEGIEVHEGQPAVFDGPVFARGSRVVGRALDDRVGCAVAIEAMRRLSQTPLKNEVYFVFTVQEEVAVRGAYAAGYGVNPDVAIAVDVTGTGDQPHDLILSVKLGAGTAIKVLDKGMIVPPAVRDWMVDTADANNIPYQMELLPMGQTDAAAIQRTRAGVPGGVVSIPCRYIHTISETVDIADVEASVDLLAALVAAPVALQQT